MSKLTGSIFLLLTLSALCLSQAQPNSVAPTKWERYGVPEQQATVLLPKLPLVINSGNTCRGEKRSEYGAYSEGAAYVAAVVSKVYAPYTCRNIRKDFDEENFTDRVAYLLKPAWGAGAAEESDVEINGRKWKQLRGRNIVHMLYYDQDQKRWFELSVYSHDLEKPEVKEFLSSLSFDQKIKGNSIKSGSKTTLGDDQTEVKPVVAAIVPIVPSRFISTGTGGTGSSGPAKEDENQGVMIAMKPHPVFTTAARQARINGTVRLKVAMLNNGSIGEITVVSELPEGLTDEAIAAARRILFVPAKKDKAAISVTKIIEFSFSTSY